MISVIFICSGIRFIIMASLKTNVLLNLVNTFVNIAIPVVTFPYATGVLQLEGLGLANFLGSVINYIVLITGLGIPMYAVKEVARYRDDVQLRNHCTMEIAHPVHSADGAADHLHSGDYCAAFLSVLFHGLYRQNAEDHEFHKDHPKRRLFPESHLKR